MKMLVMIQATCILFKQLDRLILLSTDMCSTKLEMKISNEPRIFLMQSESNNSSRWSKLKSKVKNKNTKRTSNIFAAAEKMKVVQDDEAKDTRNQKFGIKNSNWPRTFWRQKNESCSRRRCQGHTKSKVRSKEFKMTSDFLPAKTNKSFAYKAESQFKS